MVVIPKLGMPAVAAFLYLIRYDICTLVLQCAILLSNDRKYTVFHDLISIVQKWSVEVTLTKKEMCKLNSAEVIR